MGSPDYPGEEHQRELTPPPSHSLPMHGQPHDTSDSGDESDDTIDMVPGTDDVHAGYQLLSQDSHQPMALENFAHFSDNDDDDDHFNSGDEQEVNVDAPNLPTITPIDGELLRNVWNAPRPAELDIDLDAKRSAEVPLHNVRNFSAQHLRLIANFPD